MPLIPSNVKHRKQHTRNQDVDHVATRCNTIAFGTYGLQALEGGEVTARQIEAARVAAAHFLGRVGKLWIRIFPHTPVTKRAADTRMGTGKGEVEYWASKVQPGTVLYEIAGVPEDVARETLKRMARKLSLKARLVRREGVAAA